MEKYINKEMKDKGYTLKNESNSLNKKNSGNSLRTPKKRKTNNINRRNNKKSSSIKENNNPPPKKGNNKGNLKDKMPESNDILYNKNKFNKKTKEYKIPIEDKNEKKKIKDLNTINPDEIQIDKMKKFKELIPKNHKRLITESNVALNTNESSYNRKEIHSDKSIKKQKSEEEIKENNRDINEQENNNYVLILINANNTGNHLPLNSNYILNNYDYEEVIEY